jgi:hypothetical protein
MTNQPDDPVLIADVVRLKLGGQHTWRQLGQELGVSWERARALFRRHGDKPQYQPLVMEPNCLVEGVTPSDYMPDEEEVYQSAIRQWKHANGLERRRQDQRITFTHGPAALIFCGDQHLGNRGTDVPRLFREAELMAAIPGARVIILGDLVDNFVLLQMARLRHLTRFAIPDEWVLTRRYLRLVAPRLAAVVAGNHELWTHRLTGLDYFGEVVGRIAPGVIYAPYDAIISVHVGKIRFPMRVRHHWRGRSIYNPTHGIERAAKWDQNFLLGVGAHTHDCGVARGFNVGGRSGMAVLVGSYKRHDEFADERGFPRHNDATAVGVVLDDTTSSMTGFESLEMLAKFMKAVYVA